MLDKLIVVSFILAASGLMVSRSKTGQLKSADIDGYEEEQFVANYSVPGADIYKVVDNDSMRCYHIGAPDSSADSNLWFGWFEFHVKIFSDSIAARKAYNSVLKNGNAWKAPEYYLLYGRRHYSLSTGCFNADKMDSIYHSFRDGLDTSKMQAGDLIRVECGGDWITGDGRTWPITRP